MTDDNDDDGKRKRIVPKADPIGDFLGVGKDIVPKTNTVVASIMTKAHDDSATADFEKARATIHRVMEVGASALDDVVDMASQTQQPDAYAAVASIMGKMLQASKTLMSVQRDIESIRNPTKKHSEEAKDKEFEDDGTPKIVNNTIFTGTPADLMKAWENMQETQMKTIENKKPK